ncbi:MAG: NlpC/P60 family protein [Ignavibacteria bacterium]|nr:NlpC/P60 family protein [Ignavibacteria bacterium]
MKNLFNFVKWLVVVSIIAILFNPLLFARAKKSSLNKKANYRTTLVQESLKKIKMYLLGYEIISADFYPNKYPSPNSPKNIFSDLYLKEKLFRNILLWLGTPYKLGGSTRKGIDCSNFVARILKETLNVNFPANAQTQARLFKKVTCNLEELSFGDLLFFTGRNRKSKKIGHVGIYLGNGIFVHSSTSRGVIVTHISEGYYSQRFRFGAVIEPSNYLFASIKPEFGG